MLAWGLWWLIVGLVPEDLEVWSPLNSWIFTSHLPLFLQQFDIWVQFLDHGLLAFQLLWNLPADVTNIILCYMKINVLASQSSSSTGNNTYLAFLHRVLVGIGGWGLCFWPWEQLGETKERESKQSVFLKVFPCVMITHRERNVMVCSRCSSCHLTYVLTFVCLMAVLCDCRKYILGFWWWSVIS